MQWKAVCFDLDGTLLDTLEDLCDSVNRVLTSMGFAIHPPDAYRYFVGDGTVTLVRRALPEGKRDEKTIAACLEAFVEDYRRNWKVKTHPYQGVPEMLDALTMRGFKLSVLSNKPDYFTKLCVSELLPNWSFDEVFGQRDGIARKPDPAGALEIAERLNVPPENFLYLGDTSIDMKTAAAAGMFGVGVLWGFRTEEELRQSGAQAIIERPQDLLKLLD